ncbi:1582_t:CDS:2, partial [Entrophospora sp. SA101]
MNSQAKSDKVLTPEYLDWYSKLTDLPTMISDKLHSNSLKTQVRVLQMNIVPISPKQQFPISVLPKDPEEKQKHIIKM